MPFNEDGVSAGGGGMGWRGGGGGEDRSRTRLLQPAATHSDGGADGGQQRDTWPRTSQGPAFIMRSGQTAVRLGPWMALF